MVLTAAMKMARGDAPWAKGTPERADPRGWSQAATQRRCDIPSGLTGPGLRNQALITAVKTGPCVLLC